MSRDTPPPECPNCGHPMRVGTIVPRFATHPEITSYVCAECGEVLTKAEDESDS